MARCIRGPAFMDGDEAMNSAIVEQLRRAGRLDRVFIDGDRVVPEGQARAYVIDP